MKNIKYAEFNNLSCLYTYAPNTYAVKNSNYAIMLANAMDNGKINWMPFFIDLNIYGKNRIKAYITREEFFDLIPDDAREELIFHLDLLK
jgi:hypothetical protein